MESLRGPSDPNHDRGESGRNDGRQKAILLLTDGKPNISPPAGHLMALRNYRDEHPDFAFQLNSFGFGYNLDSALLLELAEEGGGTFAFIPDAVIVGTTFVNCAANILSTLTQDATLYLSPMNGAQLGGACEGECRVAPASWGQAVSLGPLRFGQSRDVVVPVILPVEAQQQLLHL